MKSVSRLLITLILALLATTVAAQAVVYGTVYQTTNVRSGPDTRFEIVGQLADGDRVQVAERDADGRWLRVILPSGGQGWLPVFAVVLDGEIENVPVVHQEEQGTPASQTDVSVISYGRVNMRSGPSIDSEIVSQLDVNDHADALARSNASNDWLLIRFGKVEGWVAYFTVTVQGDPRTLPILVPDSSGQSLIPPSLVLRARFNVRLHAAPTLASDIVVQVAFDSEVTAIARNAHGDWLYVGFNGATGWGVTQLFEISDEDVQNLPIFSAGQPTATPVVTAAPGG